MTHTPEVLQTTEISDGGISVLIRCDGDPRTDSWHTLYLKPTTTEAEVNQFVSDCKDKVAALHEVKLKAMSSLQKLTEAKK